MAAVKTLARTFSYLFHISLALFLCGISLLALLAAPQTLHLEMLPWTGSTLTDVLLAGSIFGLIVVGLAISGRLRWLFFLWSLLVTWLLLKGYVFSGYHFEAGELRTALCLIAASVIALFGAWFQVRR